MEIINYLVETCLLTHGIKSIDDKKLLDIWTDKTCENIAYMLDGEIKVSNIETYVSHRAKLATNPRIDSEQFELCMKEKKSGTFTASATLRACKMLNKKIAVTCGMGGIGNIKTESFCPDLTELKNSNLVLISAGPKDMLDKKETIKWLIDNGVKVCGYKRDYYTGYVFVKEKIELQGVHSPEFHTPYLLINEISEEVRIENENILEESVKYGIEEEKKGMTFHPSVNYKLDELTNGYSSLIQLKGLIENIDLAKKLI